MKKTIISAMIGSGLLMVSIVPAFAAIDCTIDTTGAYSTNYCKILAAKKLKLDLKNKGNVTNNVASDSYTGNVTSSLNTSQTTGVLTGNATATTNPVVTTLNGNDVTVTQACDGCQPGTGLVTLTGFESKNKVLINTSKSIYLTIHNDARVVNNVTSTANSGNIVSSMNTIGGDVLTGDATATSGVSTSVNNSVVHITQ